MSRFLTNIINKFKGSGSANNKGLYNGIVKGLWIGFASLLILSIIFIYSVSVNFADLYGEFPSYEMLENPEDENNLSSELYSADQVLMGKYFRENRSQVDFDELSPNLVNALMATEDIRFVNHSGVDLKGVLRAAIGKLTFNFAGGGSTLTQQLAENIFFNRSEEYKGKLHQINGLGKYVDKVKEWIVSIQLERDYTKKEILSMYLNTVDFGSNSFGIKVASRTFFNKDPDSLNVKESAMLVGLLQAPTRYSPVYNYDNALVRRNTVINQMKKYGFVDPVAADSIKQQPIELEYNVESHNQGMATYFRSVIRNFLLNWCEEHDYDLFADGLKIYTTLDSRMQQYAENAVAEQMSLLQERFNNHWEGRNPWIDENGREIKNFVENIATRTSQYRDLVKKYGKQSDSVDILMNKPKKMRVFTWNGEKDTVLSPIDSIKYYKRFLQTGFMAMNPHNGAVKAWVGGINHKFFKYDHVMQGRRQPGSTFKPIVYTAAIDNYFSPCYPVVDAPVTFSMPGQEPPTWTPSNSDGKYTGEQLTLRQAMARSVNSATAFVMKKIGPATVVEYAKRLGIQSPLEAVPSLCLGAGGDVSVYEMVGAYSTFVNQGTYIKPRFVTKIEDKSGNVYTFYPETHEALNEETAFLMLHMLMGATQESGGTALGLDYSLREENEIGAKTGTTQNASDGWFIGVTKDLVAGAWVGGDERSIHFRNWYEGQGARTAMPIWENFMLNVYEDPALGYEKGAFKRPNKKLSVELDCSKYNSGSVMAENQEDSIQVDQNRVIDDVNEEDIF
ncbi:MAG: penicillin-binding protein 1A [Candidatus Cyclobacteriaceae bacterium M3_2C_046]